MVPRMAKNQNKNWHKQQLNSRLFTGILLALMIVVCLYIVANCRYLSISSPEAIDSPAASIVNLPAGASPYGTAQVKAFDSEEDFKSYIDDGKRAYGDGVFESEYLANKNEAATTSAGIGTKSRLKPVIKSIKDTLSDKISSADATKYFSLGGNRNDGKSDILQTNNKNLYFSSQNQFYVQAGAAAENQINEGWTHIIAIPPTGSTTQPGTIAGNGTLLVLDNFLFMYKNNMVMAYEITNATTSQTILWQARLSTGSRLVASKTIGSKLYLTIKTDIDPAHPCPTKPLVIQNKSIVINCSDIYHPQDPILVNTIYTVLQIEGRSGEVNKNISFAATSENSAVLLSKDSIYVLWGQGGDYVSFFSGFLKNKCKGMLPNYLLDKAVQLPKYNISLAAKELELRALISNWISSLGDGERTRVTAEIYSRMIDYLRDNYCDFEQTGIAIADAGSFRFKAETNISGRISDPGFIEENEGNLQVTTVSGRGVENKMAWLVTGKVAAGNEGKVINNFYVLDNKLTIIGSQENIDIPGTICAIKYFGKNAIASTCKPDGIDYIFSVIPDRIGLQGQLVTATQPSYIYPLADDLVLVFSRNDRKIKISLFDISLPSKPEIRSEYDLNDYWTDLDANYQAFAGDKQNKNFFLPSGRGGYVFSYRGAKMELKSSVGNSLIERAIFLDNFLYLANSNGIEVFSVKDWAKKQEFIF